MKEKIIPFSLPEIGEEEIAEVVDTLKSGWLTTGKRAAQFEEALRAYCGAEHAHVVSSGTAAMHIALKALGVGKGDEVITTPFTFISTVEAIVHVGATPVLADIQNDTMNIDPNAISKKITKRTKALLPVHYAGHPCDMDEIIAIARKHKLKVIEDAAHAIGATYKGTKIGALTTAAACFSFYATKNLSTGEGGALLTNDESLAKRARILSLHGIDKDAWARYGDDATWRYDLGDLGFKYNLTDIQAAIGIHQLKKLDRMNAARRKIVERYNDSFRTIKGLQIPHEREYVRSACHLYPIRLRDAKARDAMIVEMKGRQIGVSVHFIPACSFPLMQKLFNFKEKDYPVTIDTFKRIVSLPLYSHMTNTDVDRVVATVKEIAGRV